MARSIPIVDVHAHIYPAKIAPKAVASVGDFYNCEMYASNPDEGIVAGTAEHLLAAAEDANISHFVVHSVAVKPKVVASINDFIAAECREHPNFIGFMTLHQDLDDPAAEIERAMDMGLCGIKLHPDTQQVNLDDDRLMKIYEIAEKKGLPLIIHTGDYRYDFSHPRRMKRVLHEFPNLVVNAAHFGGWSVFDLGYEILGDERCFVDVSSAMSFLGPRRTRELIEGYGEDRCLFGGDFPMWSPSGEYEKLLAAGMSEAQLERICWHSAERFLGRDIARKD